MFLFLTSIYNMYHCVVCSSSIYRFWLFWWYLQTLLTSSKAYGGELFIARIFFRYEDCKGVMFLFLTSIYNMLFSVNFALRVKVFFFRHCYVTNVMLTFYPSSSGFHSNSPRFLVRFVVLDLLVLCVCFVDRCLSFCAIVLSVLLRVIRKGKEFLL
jgi:hypothetical protein